jgi:hypothetical protein
MNAKKRSIQQEIAEEAIVIFRRSLKNNKNFGFSFYETPQQHDYGIDGYLQIFKSDIHSGDKVHTGEYYQVQVKGSRNLKFLKSGLISFSLDLKSAEFLIEEIKEPAVLIVVDNLNEIVYWHDIQTNRDTINSYKEAKKIKKKKFTIYINPSKIMPETISEIYEYLKNTNYKIARREVLKELKESTLSRSLNDLEEYKEVLNIEGYSWKYGIGNLNNAVMTIKNGDNVPITYYTDGPIKEEDVIKIRFNTKFSKAQDREKFDKVLKGKEDFTEISENSIDSLIIATNKKKIHDSSIDGKVKVNISPTKFYQKIVVYFENIGMEIKFDTQSWTSKDGSLILESSDFSNNPIRIYTKIIGTKFEIFKIHLDINYIKNYRDLYKNLNFISRAKGNVILYLLQENKRLKITYGNIKDEGKKPDKILMLLNKLIIIEEKMKVTFKISQNSDPIKDQNNINIVYQLLEKGECNVGFENIVIKTKLKIQKGSSIKIKAEKISFKILDKDIIFDEKELYIMGKIENIEEVSKQSGNIINYKISLPNALISFKEKKC